MKVINFVLVYCGKVTLVSLICDTHEMNIQRQTSVISNFLYIEVFIQIPWTSIYPSFTVYSSPLFLIYWQLRPPTYLGWTGNNGSRDRRTGARYGRYYHTSRGRRDDSWNSPRSQESLSSCHGHCEYIQFAYHNGEGWYLEQFSTHQKNNKTREI